MSSDISSSPVFQLAWKGLFYGDRHIVLRDTIIKMAKTAGSSYYRNFLPVVQSSGTGKSRAAREAAGLIFSLIINLCEPEDRAGEFLKCVGSLYSPCIHTAYPQSDIDVRSFFLGLAHSIKRQQIRYEAFFIEWFQLAKDHVLLMEPGKHFGSMEELATAWREYLECNDQAIHQQILRQTVEVCQLFCPG